MKTETAHKASPLGEEEIPDSQLSISRPLDSGGDRSLLETEMIMDEDAARIMRVLKNLPQGTRHRLLIKLLQDSVNLYIGK